MKRKYTHIGGSIFKGPRQLMILVEVDCSSSLRDEIAEMIVEYLSRRRKK